SRGDSGTDWAHRFDDHAQELLTERPEDALSLVEHPDARLAVPSADHFLPLLYTAGMAAGSGEKLDAFSKGYAWGSVSMTSYRSAA
ncbi:MAG: 4,5-DOPA dioxygenase extradiol, partial [Dietzia cercidiphylli]